MTGIVFRSTGFAAGLVFAGLAGACTASIDSDAGRGTGAAGPNAGTGTGANAGAAAGGSGGLGTGTAGNPSVPPTCTPLEPIPARIWRLSIPQFSNSVRDLLGLPQGPAVNSTGGSSEYAFFSDTSVGVDDTLAFNIYEAVEWAIEQASPRITQIAGCAAGEAEEACAQRFAQTFGARAFRRALDTSEVTALMTVYTEGRKQDFATAVKRMIEAVLQAPSFLYRSEVGTAGATETVLTPYETATQLAYLFLDSTPDQELLTAAAEGRLSTAEGIAAQVDRLLALDGVKRNISRIVLEWFGVRQALSKTTKSAVLLAGLPAADRDQAQLTTDLVTSTRMFIDDVLWQGAGQMNALVTSRRVFVNQRLATLYGVPFTGAAGQFAAAEFPDSQQRAGMLTQPGVLWAASDPEVTSIVHRGLYVHNDILCLDPVPSPGTLLEQPDIKAALAMLPTEMDKSNYRMKTNPTCKGCHSQIDPFALILENFDPVGAYRTMADGLPVDPTGEFMLSPALTGPITGAPAFGAGIAMDKLLTACATQKLSSYAIGQMIRKQMTCQVQDVHARFAAGDGKITSLFREIALSSFLRTRAGGAP